MSSCNRVFISYAHDDGAFVGRLRDELESRGADVWIDEKDISVGESISQRVEEGLTSSSFFCLVLSASSISRPWVRREYGSALHIQLSDPNRGLKVLPIRATNVALPPLLQDIRCADFYRGFTAGLEELCDAMGLARTPAPFTDLLRILERDGSDPLHKLREAVQTQDMSVLTPVWNAVIDGANRLVQELATNLSEGRAFALSNENIIDYLDGPRPGVALLGLPSLLVQEELAVGAETRSALSYRLTVHGVEDLFSYLLRYRRAVERRWLYLVPESVS